jgi:hypothetical protein
MANPADCNPRPPSSVLNHGMKSANGAIILVLGILSMVGFGCLAGIPAWIMGNNALADINAGYADPSELGLVQAGRILGMITTILTLLGFLAFFLFFGGMAILAGLSGNP